MQTTETLLPSRTCFTSSIGGMGVVVWVLGAGEELVSGFAVVFVVDMTVSMKMNGIWNF